MGPKAIARALVKYPWIGVPVARILGWAGAVNRRSRVLELCTFMPRVVHVRLPHALSGRRFRLTSADKTDQIAWRLWVRGWEGFERPLPDLFGGCVHDAKTVFDIGANSGLYAVASATISPAVKIHAFEPLPSVVRYLRQNVELNGLTGRITVVDAAVSETVGQAELFVPAGTGPLLEMSASLNGHFRPEHSQVLKVRTLCIDDYVRDNAIDRVDLMKIDVESQEHRVLSGAQRVLREHRPIIFLEVLPDAEAQGLDHIRQTHNYCSIQLRTTGITKRPAVRVDRHATNQVLCPAEKLQAFCTMAATMGYPILDHPIGGAELVPDVAVGSAPEMV